MAKSRVAPSKTQTESAAAQPRKLQTPRAPKNPVAPTVGIIGGGQLAKMLGQAASQLGLQTVVLSEQPHCPAASSVTRVIQGGADEIDSLRHLAEACDLVTLENEFVDSTLLEALEQSGHSVAPS